MTVSLPTCDEQPSFTTPRNYGNLQLAVASTAMAALTLHFTMHKEEIRQVQEASERAGHGRTSPQTGMNAAEEGGGGMFEEELT